MPGMSLLWVSDSKSFSVTACTRAVASSSGDTVAGSFSLAMRRTFARSGKTHFLDDRFPSKPNIAQLAHGDDVVDQGVAGDTLEESFVRLTAFREHHVGMCTDE